MSEPASADDAGRVTALLRDWSAQTGVDLADGARPGEHVVQLPGEAKLRTTVSLLVGRHALGVTAFLVRNPDENHEAFYRWLLTRNSRLPGLAFALDRLGDVYLRARLPLRGVDARTLDDLLGAVLTVADESFDELLALGFATAIRREWAWRTERGEPTRNLDAFTHLLGDEPPPRPA